MSATEKEIDLSEQMVEHEQVEQPAVDAVGSAVLNSGELDAAAEDIADAASIGDFTAPRSKINHGHAPDKHDVRSSYGVRDDFVSEFFADFGIAPNDHAALWLLSYRKDEAIAHDEAIFNDAPDTASSKWNSIESRKSSAPIAPETQRTLKP